MRKLVLFGVLSLCAFFADALDFGSPPAGSARVYLTWDLGLTLDLGATKIAVDEGKGLNFQTSQEVAVIDVPAGRHYFSTAYLFALKNEPIVAGLFLEDGQIAYVIVKYRDSSLSLVDKAKFEKLAGGRAAIVYPEGTRP